MGYQQGLSGLAGASNQLDVIGNNIANADTVGFKTGTAQFADMYANTLATSVNNQIGIGTSLAAVQQSFSQGTFTTTDSALDVAIDGNGFFQMSSNGTTTYTRDGEFHRDSSGNIVNASGANLMGYAANANGVINTAATVPLTAPTTNIAPTATTAITAQFNLNSADTTPTNSPFNPADSTTYNYTTSVQSYDSLGGTQNVNLYFVKTGTNTWEAYSSTDGTSSTASDLGTVAFSSSGAIASTTDASTGAATTDSGKFTISLNTNSGAATPQTISLDLTGTTQYGGKDGVNNLTQNGYASGTLTSYSIGTDGIVSGVYSNGQTATLGQIVLANFNNPNGLISIGGNQYTESAASGVPQIAAPGSTNHGTLLGSTVENSTVDLTSQLVNLITAQRDYQANAQTIKTQQTVDQTLVNL